MTLRIPVELYEQLNILSKQTRVSKNRIIREATSLYVEERSQKLAKQLQEMAQKLRAYRDRDPEFHQSIRTFADAESHFSDPLEGTVVDADEGFEDKTPHSKLKSLLHQEQHEPTHG